MLTEPLIQQLHQLRLAGMAAALEQQQVTGTPDYFYRNLCFKSSIILTLAIA
jgi:hypothetical protein